MLWINSELFVIDKFFLVNICFESIYVTNYRWYLNAYYEYVFLFLVSFTDKIVNEIK